ncbi:hypothetical protein EDD15DRAFT_2376899 [Pisolithus albus]|nr:hypothetical protein EDD15DRAFT_2376899 [Pisolithus albus]
MAIDGICMEILVEMVIKYEEDGLELEAGFYPEHKRSMATILFNDTQTFRSEIKKAAIRIVPFEYCLYPPENIEDDGECIEFVKKKAAQLLEGAQYLRGDVDSLGRTSNFAHPALRKICLAVYYCNSSKSLRQFVEFQTSIPNRALVLVSAIVRSVLMTFKKHGTIKNETLCGEEVNDAYHNLTSLVDQVWHNEYHGNKLERMLWEWARAGITKRSIEPDEAADCGIGKQDGGVDEQVHTDVDVDDSGTEMEADLHADPVYVKHKYMLCNVEPGRSKEVCGSWLCSSILVFISGAQLVSGRPNPGQRKAYDDEATALATTNNWDMKSICNGMLY